MKRRDPFIHFAIAPGTPIADRENTREHVAEKFKGVAATTVFVGVRDYGRLYKMRSTASVKGNA